MKRINLVKSLWAVLLVLCSGVVHAVTLNKNFGLTLINPGDTTTLTISVFNDQTQALTNVGWSDTLPAGMTIQAAPAPVNTCGGTLTATAGTNLIQLAGGTVPALNGATVGQCDVTVAISTAVQGNSVNSIPANNLTSTTASLGNFTNTAAANATIQVSAFAAPSISTTLNPSTIYLGQTATYTVTLTNNDANGSLTNAAWAYTLPAGLIVNGVPSAGAGCGTPTLTGSVGGSNIGMSGGTILKNSACSITIPITGDTQGNYSIALPSGMVSSYQGVTNATGSNQSIAVQSFVASVAFSAATVRTNQIATLTYTITSAGAYTSLAFSNDFSAQTGLVIAPTPNASSTCNAGGATPVVTASAGTQLISLSGGAIAAGTYLVPSTCTVSVDVVVPVNANAGVKNISLAIGAVTGVQGVVSASNIAAGGASLTVTAYAAPTLSKALSKATAFVGEVINLTIGVKNNDATTLTNVGWTDTLPAGMVVAGATANSAGCTGTPLVSVVAGPPDVISLSGASVATGATCTITIPVKVTSQGGPFNNVMAIGVITNNQNATNTASATATLTSSSTLSASKSVNGVTGTANMSTNLPTKLRVTLSNNATDSYTNSLAFTDNFSTAPSTLPVTFTIATTPNLVNTCGGTATATAGASSLSLSGGTLAAGTAATPSTCYVEVDVVATAAFASKINSIASVTATSDQTAMAASTTAAASITLTANALTAPTFSAMTYSASPIVVGSGSTTLSISVKNNDVATTLSNLTWSDTFPAGTLATAAPSITTAAACGVGATASLDVTNTILTLSGATLAPNAVCTVTVAVKGTQQGAFTNTVTGITSTESGTVAATKSATVVVSGLTASKTFKIGATTVTDINVGETATLIVTITNPSTTESYTALALTDNFSNFATALQIAATPNASTTCPAGVLTATAGTQLLSMSGATLAANSSCTVQVDVTAMATTATKANTIAAGTTAASTGAGVTATSVSNASTAWNSTAASANLQVTTIANPTFSAKAFGTTPIFMGQNSLLTISVTNNDATATLHNVSWTDTFPAGLVTSGAATANAACGTPTVSGTGLGSITFSGGTIAPGAVCTITINVTGTVASATAYSNQLPINSITTTENVSNTAASPAASLTVKSLVLSKSFVTPVGVGAVSTLTLNITNNTTTAYSGINLTDNFTGQTGLTIANPPNIQNLGGTGCTVGTVTATAGGTTIDLAGFALAAGTSAAQQKCTVKVDVVSTLSGTKTNTLPANALTAVTPATQNIAAATANLVVNAATMTLVPTFTVAVGNAANTIAASGTDVALLRFTLTNPNKLALNSLSLSNTFPANMTGLQIAGAALGTVVNTCGGTLTATPGTNSISLTSTAADVIPANGGTCYIEVPVVTSSPFNNRSDTGITASALTSAGETVTPTITAPALSAVALGISNAFASAQVLVGATTQLTITLTNLSATTQTSVQIPNYSLSSTKVAINNPNGLVNTCGGTVAAAAGGQAISMTGVTLAANGSCSITLDILGSSAGSANSIPTVKSAQQTTAVTANTATINVINPTVQINTITKAFTPASISLIQTSRASITWSSSSAGSIVNPVVTDVLPVGLVVAATPNVSASCATGTQPTIASTTIAPGGGQIVVGLTLTQIKNQSCTLSFDVSPTKPGTLTNTLAKGDILSADGTTAGSTVVASANLTVTNVMTVVKAFQPNVLGPGGVSVLTITLTNPEATALTGVSLTDNLPNAAAPNNLVIANPANVSTNCTVDGNPDPTKMTATPGTRAITLTGGIVPPKMGGVDGVCTITVSVTPNGAYNSGSATNTIAAGVLTSTEGRSNINSTTDTITFSAPSLAAVKSFSPTLVSGGSVSRLKVTITNPATYVQTGLAFTDNMPAGMSIGAPPNPATTCSGGTFSGVTVGAGSWSFSGGSVPANGSCDVTVNVTSNVNGNVTNTIPIGGVTSANGGSIPQAASASLSNLPGLSVSKSFSPNPATVNQPVRLTLVITNTDANTTVAGLGFLDDLTLNNTQSGLNVAAVPNISNTCGGTVSTTSTSVRLTGGQLNPQSSCRIDVDLTTNTLGSYTNTIPAGALTTSGTATNGQPGTDTLPVYAALRAANQLSPTSDTGRFVLTMTPAAPSGTSTRTGVGHDATPTAVSAFMANGGTAYTLTATGQGTTNIANYVTTYRCANADGVQLASGTGTSVTITPPATAAGVSKNQQDITCTFTETRRSVSATVVLRKSWSNAVVGDAVTITGTGLTTLNSTAASTSQLDIGATDTSPTGTVVTLAESYVTGLASNYISTWSCTGTTGLSGNVLTLGPTDTAIVCTISNAGKSMAKVTLQKAWVNAKAGDAVNVTGTGLTTLASTAAAANKTDTGVVDNILTGTVLTLGETFTTGTAADYNASWSCLGTAGLSGNVLTIGAGDTNITCTLTNSAKAMTINGTVFKDTGTGGGTANDGLQNGAEVGIAGVTVTASNAACAGGICSTTTDGAGNYSFTLPNSASGAIVITETNPAGMFSSGGSVGTSGGTYNRVADTISFTLVAGTSYNGLNFGDVPDNQFLTDGVQAAMPGTVVYYPHRFVAGTSGSVTFSLAAQATPATGGWSEILYEDANCNAQIDAGEVPVATGIAVTAGQTICLLVKEFVPAAAPVNAQNALTITASVSSNFSGTAVSFSYVRHDLTTVGQSGTSAGLTLVKSVNVPTALPGSNVVYSVVYTNNSSGLLSNVVINDHTPAYTLFQSASCGTLPLNFSACNITNPAVGAAGAIVYTFTGTLAPGSSGTVSFTVQVQP